MGIKYLSRTVRERIMAAWKRQWAWIRRHHDATQQEQESGSKEILVTHTITQETTPRASSKGHSEDEFREADRVLRQKLVLMAEDEFSPSGSPTGTALGIPAEHLLDESPPDKGELIQPIPLSFDNPFATPPRTRGDSLGSDSTIRGSTGTPSAVQPTPTGFNNPFATPPQTDCDSSDSSLTVRAATGSSSGGLIQLIPTIVVTTLDSGTLAIAEGDSLEPNPMEGNLTNGSQESAVEPGELADSELVHICTLCGHRNWRSRRGSVG